MARPSRRIGPTSRRSTRRSKRPLARPFRRLTSRTASISCWAGWRCVSRKTIARVAQLPGVKAVSRDPLLRLHTDTSAQFLGAPPVWAKLQGAERAGEGIIVGVLDTGVWPEHPSFSDPDASGKAYPPPPTPCRPSARSPGGQPRAILHLQQQADRRLPVHGDVRSVCADGFCVAGEDFTSARDSIGHGTHTASTAAGNRLVESQSGLAGAGRDPVLRLHASRSLGHARDVPPGRQGR